MQYDAMTRQDILNVLIETKQKLSLLENTLEIRKQNIVDTYHKQFSDQVLKHDEEKRLLKRQLLEKEISHNEVYLVDKIERLEDEIRQAHKYIDALKNCGKVKKEVAELV